MTKKGNGKVSATLGSEAGRAPKKSEKIDPLLLGARKEFRDTRVSKETEERKRKRSGIERGRVKGRRSRGMGGRGNEGD